MQTPLERAELVSQLLGELRGADGATTPHRGLTLFARAVLRRADDRYLYRHRLTTLSAQLRDTYRWAMAAMGSRDVVVRVFQPTIQRHGYSIEDGWILETVMPDQPFIFDTLQLFMEQREIKVLNTLRIILPVRLTNDGELGSVDANSEGAENFSYTRWYIQLPAGPGAGDVAAGIERRLTLARTMVRDFHRMIRDIAAVANEFEYLATLERDSYDDCLEIRDFLQWLSADTFVFSGLSCYRRLDDGRCERVPARGLGVAPDGDGGDEDDASALAFFGDSEAPRWPLARVRKSAADSIIHRSGKVDEVLVRTFDQDGRPNGGIVIHGMFTFKGLGQPGGTIPILRRKLDSIAAAEGTVRASYDHKGLVHAYNALPVEYLFEADADTVRELIWMTVRADSAHDIRSHIVGDSSSRSAYAFVVMPKENFSDDLRAQLQDLLLERLDANYADHRIHLGKFGSVALHFYLTGSHGFGDIDLRAVERDLVEAGTPWRMRLRRALQQAYPDAVEEAARRFDQWACAFGEGYTEHTHPADAVVDIDHLQQVLANGATRFDLRPDPSDRDVATLSIYSIEPLMLTAILPVVDQLGVVVAEQHAFTIRRAPTLTVNTLRVLRGDPDILDQRDNLVRALGAVFARRMRSDRLNRILIPARLGWRKVDVLRAYHNYSRQLGHQATTEMVQKTLIVHASYTRNLADLFHVRFDPAQPYDETTRAERERQLVGDLLDYLDDVNSYEEDRILRTFLDLIRATVRTSFYRRHDDGVDHYLSLKLDCARVHEMPAPRPLYEVYVHHAEFEGVHLRAGRVARGGIRWSDRQDDYRTEVLGLLATQVLKTTLTVPTGAKGGFVLKAPPDDWAEARRKADVAYRVFIRGLLDVTDNITAGRVVPPPQVRRFDGDDPYLVVAADKGTTHLADTANAIAAEYGFWLGDAFASGGSMGLDKRGVGIGALGVWVAVKRHFLELSVDPERDPVTVVGIGDMSGDLFGHGMLLSRTLRLVGAFDQRHVFVDPEPDPVVSFAERQRLFDRGRSTWRDYDPAAISPGGGVWDRGAKSIPLSPEVRARLGTRRAEVSGEALVRLLLQADVDLLWNGGVGTYIKASSEAHADVGDATNDRVRVDARQVRFRVIGEGGNLGITMAGRVELSGRGARVNLDAVDNCAGVALNDREVNLKTLLNPVVRAGGLTRAQRDQLLTEVAAGIRAAVLEDNDAQCLAISLDCVRSAHDPWAFFHASEFLEDEIYFSRRDEQLPDTQETVEQRLARGQGYLTGPRTRSPRPTSSSSP
ncbi:MAG: hypothetical protein CSA66_05055 [Proteobacteria bacterium]|nr:MAG: hypothetical protein CSA66_05055 [Pseudomonadota bacterium]